MSPKKGGGKRPPRPSGKAGKRPGARGDGPQDFRGPQGAPRKSSGRHGGRGSGSTGRGVRDLQFDERGAPGANARDRDRGSRGDGRDYGRARGRGRDQRERVAGDDGAPSKRGPRRRADGGQVCVIGVQGKFLVAEPFFAMGDRIVLGRGGAEEGELVLVVPDQAGVPQIVERLGSAEITADVIAALLRERDYSPVHDDETLAAAAEAVLAPDPAAGSRRDLTALPTFTIDPKTAKDFDDAISAEQRPDGAVIWVHIADVTSFAPQGSIVDRAGRARATSTYVPGFVAPMLPPQLADDACSLVPGVERRAVTVEMLVKDGVPQSAEVYRSLIRSDQRLTYEDVDEIFEGAAEAQDPWATPLAVARQVARDLVRERPQQLELDIPEPEFEFDPSGQVTSQRPSQHTESHKLIEMLMVLANEQVARILEAGGAPGMFRIHELPEASSAERLVEQLLSLGIAGPPLPEQMTPPQAAAIVAECSSIIAETVKRAGRGHLALPLLILRALKLASYSPVNVGHAGLGLRHYCHFTSPIRRYPDIVCHRAVLALAEEGRASIGPVAVADPSGPRAASAADVDDDDPLSELAKHCSDQERASMAVEREADRIAKAMLLRDYLNAGGWGDVWRGEVTGIIPAGLFVNFGSGFDGMVPLRALRGDWWEANAEGTILSADSGRAIHLGDKAEVTVDRLDVLRGKVDLRPVAIGGDL